MSDVLRGRVSSQRKKEFEIEMNRFLSVSEPGTVTLPMRALNIFAVRLFF